MSRGPIIVTDRLIIHIDAGNLKSYPLTGITCTDLVNTGKENTNGTLTNGPVYSGTNMGCIVLDGVNDTIEMGNSTYTDFSNVDPWSMVLTFQTPPIITTALNFNYLLKGSSGAAVGGFFLYFSDLSLTGDSTTAEVKMRHNATVRLAGTIELTQVISIVITYAGSGNMECYINGVYLGNFGAMTGFSTGTNLSIGVGNTYTRCQVYNFMKYSKQLSASEVLQNYNAIRTRLKQ